MEFGWICVVHLAVRNQLNEWMNIFITGVSFWPWQKKLKCFEIQEYLCAYCLQREIRDNWKWASFALSNSMHARFNIYNGSHKNDKERTVNTQLQMRTIVISNTSHSIHITSSFALLYLYARSFMPSLISPLVFHSIYCCFIFHFFLFKIPNTGKRWLLSEKHFLFWAIHRRQNNSFLIRFNEFSSFC